jgi:3-hydroxyacyl-CoA dehydrogenase
MIKIEKIAIIGAGAMEAAHAAMFSEAGNFSVSFLALG